LQDQDEQSGCYGFATTTVPFMAGWIIGFGYVMNQMASGLTVAGTGASLTEALYGCL
jgi:hypothetical protein